jgi:N,N'-diacetylchitobiose transport system permease protein
VASTGTTPEVRDPSGAAGSTPRQRAFFRPLSGSGRRRRSSSYYTPYALATPALVVLIGVLGYPMVKLVILSFQKWGLAQIFDPDAGPQFAGLDNYQRIFSDSFFWTVLLRTVLVAAAMVVFSMLAGLGVALVMGRVPNWCRWLMTFSLVLAWAVPHPVSTEMFAWLTDFNYGVVNWLFGIPRHNWYIDNVQGLGVATAVVVWGAVPLIAITLHAALGQIPTELVEAARVDGASGFQVLRRVTLPLLRPILTMLTTLSIVWDFQVFTQIWVLRQANPTKDYFTLGIYSYAKAYYSHDYGYASALAVVTVLLLIGVMAVYLRQILRMGEIG